MIIRGKYKEIPNLDKRKEIVLNYKSIPISYSNSIFNEPYVNILDLGIKGKNYYHSNDNPPYNQSIPGSIKELFLRYSVFKKLLQVNRFLSKFDLEIFVFDCFRPFDVQNFMWHKWVPDYLKKQNPKISLKELYILRNEFTSKGAENEAEVDFNAPAPHSTGGAIDLTVKEKSSKTLLNMGTIFDDFTEASYTDYYEIKKTKNKLTNLEKEAMNNRRIFFWAMESCGFVNYPYEWWHFSWGDQMWAILSENSEAYYSFLKPY